jgi:transcriptional repressor NrdR
MKCPFCGSDTTKVKDTRPCRGDTIRKRVCVGCGKRFSTAERITAEYMQVRKRDGSTQPFSRAKIRDSMMKAAAGSNLQPADLNAYVDRVIQILQPDAPDIPIPSKTIGDLVLQQFRGAATTDVARVRYAMVFRGRKTPAGGGFPRLADFVDWLEDEYGPPRVAQPRSTPSQVIKKHNTVEPFQIDKLSRGIAMAAKGRGTDDQVRSLVLNVTSTVHRELRGQNLVTSQQIASEVLKALRVLDPVAYLRYAAAVKGYRSVDDFWMDAFGLMAEQAASLPQSNGLHH